MAKIKRCAVCGHAKSKHRVGWCTHQSTSLRNSGWGPWHTTTTDCRCKGWEAIW